MFYSHELLTDRQHGVATIWLVATLGSRSNLRTVSRKAITDINVSKACETITNPEVPLALRFQASLLYGVSRVHSHQCGYMLSDMYSFKDRINESARTGTQLDIDLLIGKMKPDHLSLPEDPMFMPELDLNFDLSAFDCLSHGTLATQEPGGTSLQLASEDEPGPLSPSINMHRDVDYIEPNSVGALRSVAKSASHAGADNIIEESPIIDDPGFEIADDGSIVLLPPRDDPFRRDVALSAVDSLRDSVIGRTVRTDHENYMAYDQARDGFDDYPILLEDIEPLLPSARPFSPLPDRTSDEQGQPQQTDGTFVQGSSSTTTANAPQQRARKSKPLRVDARAELTNAELHQWANDYLAHMASVIRHKENSVSVAQAKKNAAFWIMDQGIGSVEILFGQDRMDHPLAVFSGQSLLDALKGSPSSPPGSKRSHTPSEDEDQQSRRVRAKIGGGEDEEAIILDEDDMRIESEVGRHAQSSLPDRPSVMPWNMSGSRQGSAVARLFGSTGYHLTSSAGEVTGMPQSLSRRGSRLTSASPLLGKGRSRLPSLDIRGATGTGLDMGLGLGSDVDNFNPDDLGMQSPSEDFELYRPSAKVDVQTVANSKSITLDELLPPEENTSVVGAQALLHVLSLTTKGLVDVEQKEPWEAIRLWVVGEPHDAVRK
ncbi:hypothetical protein DV736_g182, partial [Chaetothyriales sp. CBS 134916]